MSDRQGPSIRLEVDCFGCAFEATESYRCQGDSGNDVYCTHPAHGEDGKDRRYVGDTKWKTPDWCPLRAEALASFLAAHAAPII